MIFGVFIVKERAEKGYKTDSENIPKQKAEKTADILSSQAFILSSEFEKRLTHLSELSSYISNTVNTTCETDDPNKYLDTLFLELNSYASTFNFHSELLPENKKTVLSALNSLYDFDRAVLAKSIARRWEEKHGESMNILQLLNGSEFLSGRISYVKSRYSDKAFDVFESLVDESKVLYAKNFQSVCEDIIHGFAQYGILPLSDMQGAIETVNRLLSAYELKICAVCDITTQEDSAARFALVSDKICVNLEEENRYFSFSFNSSEPYKMQSALYTSELCGLSLYDMKVTPSYSGSANYRLTFRENSGDLIALLVYLKLFLPQFVINGIYFEI